MSATTATTATIPFLAYMPSLFSPQPLPPCIAEARAEWQAAAHTARKDLAGAARAFLKVAALLAPAATGVLSEVVTSIRLVALENALEAGTAAGDRDRVERELWRLSWREPALNAGIGRLLRGDRETEPPAPSTATI